MIRSLTRRCFTETAIVRKTTSGTSAFRWCKFHRDWTETRCVVSKMMNMIGIGVVVDEAVMNWGVLDELAGV